MYVCCVYELGSSHSDKEVDQSNTNTPEKICRTTSLPATTTPSERKRKRKADDTGVVVAVQVGAKGPRTASSDTKKLNDYFVKHAGNSPIRHGGAKSPSPQQGYAMVFTFLLPL